MKSPRELLLQKHRDADAKLKQLDANHLAEYARESASAKFSRRSRVASELAYLWNEMVWPWRRIWSGIGVAWVVIIGSAMLANSHPRGAAGVEAKTDPQTRLVLLEQKQMLAQLLGPGGTAQLKPGTPGPRSDARLEETYV